MPLARLSFAPGASDAHAFWDAAVDAVRRAGPLPARVFVPVAAWVEPCLEAFRRRCARPGAPWRPPRVLALDEALAAHAARPAPARRMTVLAALDADEGEASARVGAARRLLAAVDAALLAGAAEGDEGRSALLALGHALDGRADLDARLARLSRDCVRDAVIHGPLPDVLAGRYAARASERGAVVELLPDARALRSMEPVIASVWPAARLAAPPVDTEGATRDRPLVLEAPRLEDEAQAAARWTLDRLARGARAVHVLAPDDRLAGRVGALLARAGVRWDDRVGVPLATTPAAVTVAGWLAVVGSDAGHAALSIWLESAFVFPDEDRAAVRETMAHAAGEARWLRGWTGLQALERLDAAWRARLEALAGLAAEQAAASTAAAQARCTDRVLRLVGARKALADDAAGLALLDLLDAMADVDARCDFATWQAFVHDELSGMRLADDTDSVVRRLTPRDAALLPCDALIVAGANDDAWPAGEDPVDPFAADHPVADAAGARPMEAPAADRAWLAIALGLASRRALTCRDAPDEGVGRAAWVERLLARLPCTVMDAREFARAAATRRGALPRHGARAAGTLIPLPDRLSVTDVERLAACPYRFWAQSMLGLRERRDPADAPRRRELGVFVHALLHAFHADPAVDAADREATLRRLRALTDAHARELLAQGGGFLPLLAEWRAALPAYADWLARRAAQGWRWLHGEWSVEAVLQAGDLRIALRGQIDRIDVRAQDGAHSLVDYKLGSRAGQVERAADPDEHGQLPLYALLLRRAGLRPVQAGFLQIERGRVDWLPLRSPAGAADLPAPDAAATAWEGRLGTMLARIAQGASMPALGHDDECRHCEMRGLCRRAQWSGR